MNRRLFLAQAAALGVSAPAGASAPSAAGWIAQRPQLRVIVDNDFAGDPDGLFALAHQWLSPSARTVLVTSSLLNAKLVALSGKPAGRSAALSRDAALQLAGITGITGLCPVVAGAESPGAGAAQASEAAHAIVREALRDDPLPLVLTCGGPLTNVAAALRLAPEIARRMSLVWIGGSLASEGEPEYNFATDRDAARQVLLNATLPVRVVPRETYRQLSVSVAELAVELRPISPLSQWLYARYLSLPPFVQLGPTLTLGDSAMVAVALLDREGPLRRVPARALLAQAGDAAAPQAAHELLLCEHIDTRLVLADLLAQLKLHAQGARTS
jgi:hypothetical protein